MWYLLLLLLKYKSCFMATTSNTRHKRRATWSVFSSLMALLLANSAWHQPCLVASSFAWVAGSQGNPGNHGFWTCSWCTEKWELPFRNKTWLIVNGGFNRKIIYHLVNFQVPRLITEGCQPFFRILAGKYMKHLNFLMVNGSIEEKSYRKPWLFQITMERCVKMYLHHSSIFIQVWAKVAYQFFSSSLWTNLDIAICVGFPMNYMISGQLPTASTPHRIHHDLQPSVLDTLWWTNIAMENHHF